MEDLSSSLDSRFAWDPPKAKKRFHMTSPISCSHVFVSIEKKSRQKNSTAPSFATIFLALQLWTFLASHGTGICAAKGRVRQSTRSTSTSGKWPWIRASRSAWEMAEKLHGNGHSTAAKQSHGLMAMGLSSSGDRLIIAKWCKTRDFNCYFNSVSLSSWIIFLTNINLSSLAPSNNVPKIRLLRSCWGEPCDLPPCTLWEFNMATEDRRFL